MNIELVVSQPFADWKKGDRITDPKQVEAILKDHEHRVIKVAAAQEKP